MPWQSRNQHAYYYRSIRCQGRVRRVYCGTGFAGRLAAELDARRRAEQQAQKLLRAAQRDMLQRAIDWNRELSRRCEVLAAAVLLVAGYHSPSRHPWRSWRHGRQILGQT